MGEGARYRRKRRKVPADWEEDAGVVLMGMSATGSPTRGLFFTESTMHRGKLQRPRLG